MQPKTISKASNGECAGRLVMAVSSANGAVRNSLAKLTGAENRILAHVARAKTNKEIARDLGISPATVKRHLENLLSKLGLRNRVEAAIYGLLVTGCSAAMNSNCALRLWHKERDSGGSIWADWPIDCVER
jgi:DNA-binding NarL/FixJ family response regulator